MRVGQPNWTWASMCSTACWNWDARPTSALPEPRRGRGHCACIPDPCNTATYVQQSDGIHVVPFTKQDDAGHSSCSPGRTEELIGSIIQLLGLDLSIPGHTILSRRAATLDVHRPRSGAEP